MRRPTHLAAAIVLTWGLTAHAQSDRELATRQDLIAQARAAREKGNHAEALALAKRGAAIKMTTSLRMFVAQEEVTLGKIADAYGNARQCEVEAQGDDKLHDRDRILAACQTIATSLDKRVGRVTLRLPSQSLPGLRVTLSGEEVNAALLGAPYVVSPGHLTVGVTATGYLPYKSEVDVPEGGAAAVDVLLALDPNAPCPEGQERVAGTCVARAVSQTPAPPAEPPARSPEHWIGPLVVAGVGAIVTVIATVFYVQGGTTYSSLKTLCTSPGGCSSGIYGSEGATVRRDDALGVGGWIAGGALIGAGAAWYVLSTPKETASAATGARLWVNPVARSVGMEGTF